MRKERRDGWQVTGGGWGGWGGWVQNISGVAVLNVTMRNEHDRVETLTLAVTVTMAHCCDAEQR